MKPIFVLALWMMTSNLLCQNTQENLNCKALVKSIEHPDFDTRFHFSEFINESFIVVDTNHYFKNCESITVMGRKVIISEKWIPEKNKNTVVVARGEKNNVSFTLGFMSRLTGGSVTIDFEIKGNDIELIKTKTGDF